MFIRSARKQRRQYRRYSLFVRAWVAVASITNGFIPPEPSVVNRIRSFKCDAFAAWPGNWTVHRAIISWKRV